jgi:hypothetical protein
VLEMPKLVVSIAENVEDAGIKTRVAEFPAQIQRLLAVNESRAVATQCLIPADIEKGSGLFSPVTGSARERQCMSHMSGRFVIMALIFRQCTELIVHFGLARFVAKILEEVKGLLKLDLGFVVAAELCTYEAESRMGVSLPKLVGVLSGYGSGRFGGY